MMKENLNLDTDIQFVKGVGPTKVVMLNKLGIYTVKDLIEFFPRMYEDRTKLYKINEFEQGKNTLFLGTVCQKKEIKRIRKNLAIYSTYVCDENGVCKLTWFNQKFIFQKIQEGNTYLFYGKPTIQNGRFVVEGAVIYDVNELSKVQGIYPIYNLTAGITQNYIFKLVNEVISSVSMYNEIFDEEFKQKNKLMNKKDALYSVHFPSSFENVKNARNTLIFEELFMFQLGLMMLKNTNLQNERSRKYERVEKQEFLDLLPFKLTNAQSRVISQIENDIYSNKVMNRMVQGDVGCGKTMIAAVAMFIAVKNGYQAALMAPTTILANQHYNELSNYFSKIGVRCELLTSATTKKNKNIIIEKLKNHEIDILIGTHSLIEDNIEFDNLSLVITDEQHRFGVKQRLKLTNKNDEVDTIVMTATPIPRSLAIILYGDLDISIVDELPPGRTPIQTFAVNDSYETRVNEFIRKQVNNGRQVYIVCPLVEENDELDLKSVEMLYENYKNNIFPELNVGILHGKMKNKEKDEIMLDFKDGKIDILVSTTVIEVGISVSNATLMVIENADRFGLAQLHQLRGRVGRGDKKSYCILKSNNKSLVSRQRLKIMVDNTDGFIIAREDLNLRGPGDFFGIRQSGLPEFKIANLLNDATMLEKTTDSVKELLLKDKTLKYHENIKKELYKKFGDKLFNIGT